MAFSFAIKVFDIRDVFFFFFRNDISTYGKEVVAATLFLSSTVPKTFLIVLVFFAGLVLVGRLLVSRHISRKNVNRLFFPKILFFGWFLLLEALGINLLDI